MSETLVCDYRKVPIGYQDEITSNRLKRQSGCYINFNDHANDRIVDITQNGGLLILVLQYVAKGFELAGKFRGLSCSLFLITGKGLVTDNPKAVSGLKCQVGKL